MGKKNYNSEEQKNWAVYKLINIYSGYIHIFATRHTIDYEINYSIFHNHNYQQEDWTIASQRLTYDYFYYGKDSFKVEIIIDNIYKEEAREVQNEERKELIEEVNKNY